jgi:hypothetical protein
VRGYRPQIRHNDFRLTTHMSPFSFQGEKALCTQRMCCSRVQVCRDACELAHFMGGGRCHRYTTECNIPGRLHTVGHLTIMFLRDEGIPGQPIGRQIGRRRRTAVPLPQCSFRATVRSCKMYICRLLPTAFVSAYYSYSCPLLSRQAPYSLTIPAIPAIHTIHIIYAQCTLTYRLECLERKHKPYPNCRNLKSRDPATHFYGASRADTFNIAPVRNVAATPIRTCRSPSLAADDLLVSSTTGSCGQGHEGHAFDLNALEQGPSVADERSLRRVVVVVVVVSSGVGHRASLLGRLPTL